MNKIKVLIVEDEPLIAENIALYIDTDDFEIIGIAYDAEEALEILASAKPDAAILDIHLDGDKDGIAIAEEINRKYKIPFLFLTAYSDSVTINRAKEVNPSGYIVKPFNEQTVKATLQIAISNFEKEKNKFIPSLSVNKMNAKLLNAITEREFEIVEMVLQGLTNTQIVNKIYISINTLKTHLKSIHLKLDVNSRLHLINKLRDLAVS